MKKKKLFSILLLILLFSPLRAFAETIILKSDRIVKGKILEKTEKYIKMDVQGVPQTYSFDEIETIDDVNATDPWAYITKGDLCFNSGKFEDALHYYRFGNNLSLDNQTLSYFHHREGVAYAMLGNWDRALATYTYSQLSTFVTSPSDKEFANKILDAATHYGYEVQDIKTLATVLEDDLAETIVYVRHFGPIDMRIDDDSGHRVMAIVRKTQDISREREEEIIKHIGDISLKYKGQPDQTEAINSIDEYKKTLRLQESVMVDNFLAQYYYLRNKDYPAAINRLESAKNKVSDKTLFVVAIAKVYILSGNIDRAVETLKEFLADNPDNAVILYEMGNLLFKKIDFMNAVSVYEQLREKDKIAFQVAERNYRKAKEQLKGQPKQR